MMTDQVTVTPLATPDPVWTTEQAAAFIASVVGSVVVLFKLNITDAQREAAVTLIVSAWTIATLLHAAYVRGQRAKASLVAKVETPSPTPIPTPLPTPPAIVAGSVGAKRVRPSRAKTPPSV